MRKEFETIAQYKEQMRAMLDKAEAEKRALDASEKEQFEQLKTKKELLEMKVERRALEDINAGLVSDRRVLFSQAVFDVVNHRSLEEYNGVVSEGGIKVVERAVTVTDTTDAASMVPVTIGEIIEPLEKGLIIDKLGCKIHVFVNVNFIEMNFRVEFCHFFYSWSQHFTGTAPGSKEINHYQIISGIYCLVKCVRC